MRTINIRFVLIVLVWVMFVSNTRGYQRQEKSQRDYVKKDVQYDRWQDILKKKPEIHYTAFVLDSTMIKPWHIQRVQQIGAADRGNTVQYILSKSDDPKKAEEILQISVTLCPNRATAAERLIDHLLGIQRPGFKLIEEDSLGVGDLAVHFPGLPEPGIYFFRGNILITVENAGQKAAVDIRNLAKALDQSLKKKHR